MKPIMSIPIVLTLILATADGRSLIAQAQKKTIAQVIEATGKVELKQEGESDYRLTRVGENLYVGDLLRVAKGSRGVIRCTSDSTTSTVPDDGVPWGVTNVCSSLY